MKNNIYFRLFVTTFLLSAFTVGGGYVIVPLMKRRFVDENHWIDEEEMLNLVAIAQSAPGAIAVNASLLAGYRVAGVRGAVVTVFGTVLPPLFLISLLSVFYSTFRDQAIVAAVLRGMQAGVAAVIADAVIDMGAGIVKKREPVSLLIMIAAFLAAWQFGVNIMLILLACAGVGAIRTWIAHRKGDAA